MAILQVVFNKVGRAMYKQGSRFVSKNTYLRELRRGPGGRFRSKASFVKGLSEKNLESYLRDVFGGSPLGGGQWVARVQQSSYRFADILADANLI